MKELLHRGKNLLLASKFIILCVYVCVTVRGVDTEVDRDGGDSLVGSSDSVGLCFNLLTDLVEVHKLATLTVQELCILYTVKRSMQTNA